MSRVAVGPSSFAGIAKDVVVLFCILCTLCCLLLVVYHSFVTLLLLSNVPPYARGFEFGTPWLIIGYAALKAFRREDFLQFHEWRFIWDHGDM